MVRVFKGVWKLLKKLSVFVNFLPFGGKLKIREWTYWAYSGSPEGRFMRSLQVIGLLLLMILGHGGQVVIGIALYDKGISVLIP